ncbi:MAG: shikimate dehydrogenase [Betaproteobacteria bacterium]|nr:shikimate dehydrogenase [Betaproteobacteria bacterium]
MRRYAVFGFPARHSLSPWIHAYFARALQRKIVYAVYSPPPGQFAAAVRAFFAGGGRGINITAPYKKDALLFAGRASAFARRADAANVLSAENGGEISAHNTDGAGLIRDITQNLGVSVSGECVLIAGAGGAARAAALALAGLDAKITVAARRLSAAAELAELAGGTAAELSACGGGFDIVINAIPGGAAALPPEVFAEAKLAYDINYGAAAEKFLRAAAAAKLRADGGGMLAEQAALSFALWEGVMPPVKPLVNYLRARTFYGDRL